MTLCKNCYEHVRSLARGTRNTSNMDAEPPPVIGPPAAEEASSSPLPPASAPPPPLPLPAAALAEDDAARPKSRDRLGVLFVDLTSDALAAMPRRGAAQLERAPSFGALPPARGKFNGFAALAYTVNVRTRRTLAPVSQELTKARGARVGQYIVGIGVLSIPYGFYRAGWALSLLLLLAVTVFSFLTLCHILEVMCRAEAIVQLVELRLHAAATAVPVSAPDSDTKPALAGPASWQDRARSLWRWAWTPTVGADLTHVDVVQCPCDRPAPDSARPLTHRACILSPGWERAMGRHTEVAAGPAAAAGHHRPQV
jgi:hypothetical protein